MWRVFAIFSAAARLFPLPMLLLAAGAAAPAQGGESWHITPGAGVLLLPGGQAACDGAAGTLRLGYDLDAPVSIELGGLAGRLDHRDRTADVGGHHIRGTWVDTIFHLARWERLDPFLSAGYGAFWSDGRALPDHRQEGFAPRLGAGVLYTLSEHWSLRAGVTAMTLRPGGRQAAFGIAEAGLSYYFGDTTPARPGEAE
jgi:hypothetical protein